MGWIKKGEGLSEWWEIRGRECLISMERRPHY
jgi:hypothetical protein